MNSKRGIGSLWIVLIIAVLAIGGWYYYNNSANISGAGAQVVATKCVANPDLPETYFASLGVTTADELNAKCNERLVSIGCNGWDVPSSSLKACVWNVNCGNGVIDAPLEQCEGANLNGKTCATYGKSNGYLSCRNDCKVDQSDCY